VVRWNQSYSSVFGGLEVYHHRANEAGTGLFGRLDRQKSLLVSHLNTHLFSSINAAKSFASGALTEAHFGSVGCIWGSSPPNDGPERSDETTRFFLKSPIRTTSTLAPKYHCMNSLCRKTLQQLSHGRISLTVLARYQFDRGITSPRRHKLIPLLSAPTTFATAAAPVLRPTMSVATVAPQRRRSSMSSTLTTAQS